MLAKNRTSQLLQFYPTWHSSIVPRNAFDAWSPSLQLGSRVVADLEKCFQVHEVDTKVCENGLRQRARKLQTRKLGSEKLCMSAQNLLSSRPNQKVPPGSPVSLAVPQDGSQLSSRISKVEHGGTQSIATSWCFQGPLLNKGIWTCDLPIDLTNSSTGDGRCMTSQEHSSCRAE